MKKTLFIVICFSLFLLVFSSTNAQVVLIDGGSHIVQLDSADHARLEPAIYRLVSKRSGKILAVQDAGQHDGCNVHQWDWNQYGSREQAWVIKHIGEGFYTLSALHSNKLLDQGGGKHDGCNVHQWSQNGSNAQKWKIFPISRDGQTFYLLISRHSEKVLDQGGRTNTGANVHIWSLNLTDAQLWKIEKVDPSLFFIN